MGKKRGWIIGILLLSLFMTGHVVGGMMEAEKVSAHGMDTAPYVPQGQEFDVLARKEDRSEPGGAILYRQEFDVLARKGVTVGQIEQALSAVSADIETVSTPQIGLVHVALPAGVDKETVLGSSRMHSLIYAQGELADIQLPGPPIEGLDLSQIHSLALPYAELTDEELFDFMAWHVDEVTNGRASLDKSKGAGTKIAVIDSGIDVVHPILAGKINQADSVSYVEGEPGIQDTNGHGTSVAGVIAQIAPEAQITAYRVIGDTAGSSEWTIQAVLQAAEDGNDIINMSLGMYKCVDIESERLTMAALERAIQYAQEKDVVVVASAGNKALNLDQYYEMEHIRHLPGGLQEAVTVSSVNQEALASYSNYGTNIDYSAPGGDLVYINGQLDISQWIYCLYPTTKDNGLTAIGVPQGYSLSYGTSLAAPQVAAALADLLAADSDASAEQLIRYLAQGAKDLGESGYDVEFGEGEINIDASLLFMQEHPE